MPTTQLERDIASRTDTIPNKQVVLDWDQIERLGINKPAPEMTNWKALQKYIGVRRGVIHWIDDLMRTTKRLNIPGEPNNLLLNRRRELSATQRYDRLRLAGKI